MMASPSLIQRLEVETEMKISMLLSADTRNGLRQMVTPEARVAFGVGLLKGAMASCPVHLRGQVSRVVARVILSRSNWASGPDIIEAALPEIRKVASLGGYFITTENKVVHMVGLVPVAIKFHRIEKFVGAVKAIVKAAIAPLIKSIRKEEKATTSSSSKASKEDLRNRKAKEKSLLGLNKAGVVML